MSEWRDITLGEFVRLQRGHDLTEEERRPGEIPVMGSAGMNGTHDTAIAKGPGVVIGRSGASFGRVSLCTSDFWPHNTSLYVTDFLGNDPFFSFYFLRAIDFSRFNSGSAQQSLNRNHIYPLAIRVPPLNEQRAIARILGALDDKIELNRQMNETLEALARALFQSWFVDFDPVRAKMRGEQPVGMDAGTAALFPSSLVQTDHGEIPFGWRWTTLGSIAAVLEAGGRPKGGVASYSSGIPSIGAESIVGIGKFDFKKTKYVPEAFHNNMKKGVVLDYDVLLYKDGGRPGEFEPHVSMFGNGFPFTKMSINEHVYRIRATDPYGQAMLYFSLSSEGTLEEMRRKGTGVAIPGLNSTAAKSLTFIDPGMLSDVFCLMASPIIDRVLKNANEAKVLADTRDFLLPRLLSGELRVPDAEHLVEQVV